MELTGSRPLAVVTGASSGIGRELAARFAEAGFDLVVAAEDERIGPVTDSLAGPGIQAVPVQADLATFDGVEELHRAIKATGRVPDALAINAGVGVAGDFARDNELADELRLIGLNINGAVNLAKRVLPEMIAAGQGGVLFTSSIAATAPGPYQAARTDSQGRPGRGGQGGLRGADGRQRPRGRRVDEEQGPGRFWPGHARDRQGRDLGAPDRARQRRPGALRETTEGVRR